MEDDWPYDFVGLILKAGLFDAREPTRPPTPEEAKGHELVRGPVRVGKQVSAKAVGAALYDIIADNAEVLAASHIAKHDKAATPVALPEKLYSSVVIPPPAPSLPMQQLDTPPIKRSSEKLISRSETPAFQENRRSVEREPSGKPLFCKIASEYLSLRQSGKSGKSTDLDIAEFRLNLFVELIGDHPIDTYTPTDLQAFIDLLKYWPGN